MGGGTDSRIGADLPASPANSRARRRHDRRLRKACRASQEARRTLAWTEERLGWKKAAHGRAYPVLWKALEFHSRCAKVRGELEAVLSRPGRRAKGAPHLGLKNVLDRLRPKSKSRDPLARGFPHLEEKWAWLERIRRVLGSRNGQVPLSPRGDLSEKGLELDRRRLDWRLEKVERKYGRRTGPRESRSSTSSSRCMRSSSPAGARSSSRRTHG